MGTRAKTLTIDCGICEKCVVNDNRQFMCNWGQAPKVMHLAKGKKIIRCKLIQERKK